MSVPVTLEALDLAALLCSRVCHDLISPSGAIVNGLEVPRLVAGLRDRGLVAPIAFRLFSPAFFGGAGGLGGWSGAEGAGSVGAAGARPAPASAIPAAAEAAASQSA